MENKEMLRDEEVKKIREVYNTEYELSKLEEMIKSNSIEFEHNEEIYKIKMLTLRDKDELERLKNRYFNKLLQERDEKGNFCYLLEKDMIKLFKERGIDLDEIEKEVSKLTLELNNFNFKLGLAIHNNSPEEMLKDYKIQIEIIKNNRNDLIIQKTSLLNSSVEHQILVYITETMAYLTLEKKTDDKWLRAFATYEEFKKCNDEKLMEKAVGYTMVVNKF